MSLRTRRRPGSLGFDHRGSIGSHRLATIRMTVVTTITITITSTSTTSTTSTCTILVMTLTGESVWWALGEEAM